MRIEVDIDANNLDPSDVIEELGAECLLDEMPTQDILNWIVKNFTVSEILEAINDPEEIQDWLTPERP